MSEEFCPDCRPVFSQFCDDAPDFDGVEPCPKHAAASELLEALKRLREWHKGEYQSNADIDAAADAAIAKAEGR